MAPDWRDRVDTFWQRMFGTTQSPTDDVITQHRSPDLLDYPGIYAIRRSRAVYVSAPTDLVASIRQWNPSITTVTDPNWWHHHLPDWLILGPSVHAFTDASRPVVQTQGLHIEATTADQLLDLYSAVDPAEWREGGFANDDIKLAWRATDAADAANQTIAAANLTPFDGLPADVGVLTSPTHRGRGAATAVASVAASYAVQEFGIARWRALTTNNSSLRIAQTLGFEPDCLQIAVRPPT